MRFVSFASFLKSLKIIRHLLAGLGLEETWILYQAAQDTQ